MSGLSLFLVAAVRAITVIRNRKFLHISLSLKKTSMKSCQYPLLSLEKIVAPDSWARSNKGVGASLNNQSVPYQLLLELSGVATVVS